MTEEVLLVERLIKEDTTKAFDEFLLAADLPDKGLLALTEKNEIKQTVLKSYNFILRIHAVLKKLFKAVEKVKDYQQTELIKLRRQYPVSAGTLDCKIKVSERKAIKYKDLLDTYIPLINYCITAEDDPVTFQNMIQHQCAGLDLPALVMENTPLSRTEKIEIL